jgi:uncharacterized protein YjdB
MKFSYLLPLLSGGIAACSAAASMADAPPQDIGCSLIGVRVSPSTATLVVGDSARLTAILSRCAPTKPAGVHWQSSGSEIVSVDSSGILRGVKAGQATVIAWLNADSTVKGAAVVLVNPR